jgi:WD40 repeat protein
LAVSPDGRQIVSSGFDRTVRQWDTSTGRLQRTLRGHLAEVPGVAVSPDGGRIASASNDRTVRLWEAASGLPVGQFTGHTAAVNTVAFHPDGRWIASGGADLLIRLWNPATGREEQALTGFKDEIKHVTFDPAGRRLAAVGGQFLDINASRDDVRVWDLAGPPRPLLLQGAGKLAGMQAAFSPDGSQLAVACNNPDAFVRLWDLGTGKLFNPRHPFGHLHASTGVAFHPDQRQLATSGTDGCVTLWHLDALWERRVIRLGPPHGHIYQIAFSPDGRHLLSANGNGTVTILRLADGALGPN